MEALIMLAIGVIPPTMTVHWVILGVGLGLPIGVMGIAFAIAFLLQKLGFKGPSAGTSSYLARRAEIQVHSGLPGSTGYNGDE
jgi:hypothetical protein